MSMPNYRQTTAVVDLSRLKHNLTQLKGLLAPDLFFCPMIKAAAYGHGDERIALSLVDSGEKALGVALLEEGVRVREAGVPDDIEILVFSDFSVEELETAWRYQLTPVVSHWGHLEALDELYRQRGVVLDGHVKFNTGMARLGFEPYQAVDVAEKIRRCNAFRLSGVCTHLSQGADYGVNEGTTDTQIKAFEQIRQAFYNQTGNFHVLNSAGLISSWQHEGRQKKWGARPGLALYGVVPELESSTIPSLGLAPVMSWRTKIITCHYLEPGQRVSYGGTWEARRSSLIGVLPVGYADGYPRHLSNKAQVLFQGQRVPLVGTVCMDFVMIDLTDVTMSRCEGQDVILLGEQNGDRITSHELAGWAQTNVYEILTCISSRVPRIYKGSVRASEK